MRVQPLNGGSPAAAHRDVGAVSGGATHASRRFAAVAPSVAEARHFLLSLLPEGCGGGGRHGRAHTLRAGDQRRPTRVDRLRRGDRRRARRSPRARRRQRHRRELPGAPGHRYRVIRRPRAAHCARACRCVGDRRAPRPSGQDGVVLAVAAGHGRAAPTHSLAAGLRRAGSCCPTPSPRFTAGTSRRATCRLRWASRSEGAGTTSCPSPTRWWRWWSATCRATTSAPPKS